VLGFDVGDSEDGASWTAAPTVDGVTRSEDDSPPAPAVQQPHTPLDATILPPAAGGVSMSSGVHINIEIHIAADATSETIEDIFRNMRRYVLTADKVADDDTTGAG